MPELTYCFRRLMGWAAWACSAFVAGAAFAQPEPADDGDASLAERQQVIEELSYTDPKAALRAAEEARDRAVTLAEALSFSAQVSVYLRVMSRHDEAEEVSLAGLAQARELGDPALIARFLYEAGWNERNRSNVSGALECFQEGLPLAEAAGDVALLCDLRLGMARCFASVRNWEQVERQLVLVRSHAEALGDQRRLGSYYQFLGNTWVLRGDYPAAHVAYDESLRLHRAVDNERGVADALQNLAHIYEEEQAWDRSEEHYRQAIAIYQRLDMPSYYTNASRRLGRMLAARGDHEAAITLLTGVLPLAEQFAAPIAVSNIHFNLSQAYEAKGDYLEALRHLREHQEIGEQVLGERAHRDVAVLEARFAAERSRHEAERLRTARELQDAQLARVSAQRWSLLAVVLSGGVIVAAIIARQRLKLSVARRIHAETDAARRTAEKADALKTRLLGIASHDLKSPLGSIVSGAKLIHAHPTDHRRVQGLAAQICDQGDSMFRLIRDLIDQSALEAGEMRLAPRPFDLAGLADEVIAKHALRAEIKGVRLTTSSSDERIPVVADSARLRQAVNNLVDNAIKFSRAGAVVHLGMSIAGQRALLAVVDQGPGLQAQDMVHLFQPFQKLSAQPVGEESGTGLGLFIAHEIVALHRGVLSVDSAPGQGTTFTISLPLAA